MMPKQTFTPLASTLLMAIVGWLLCAGLAVAQNEAASQKQAREILAETGVKGGLVVHLGCGDGRLTALLRLNERYLVHGLDADAKNIERAREHILSRELYGDVSVARFDGKRLPYADDLVNLLLVENPGGVPRDELLRVLAPNGVAYVRQTQPGAAVPQWTKTVKPWPAEIDEWTHHLHDASNNAVAHDTRVGTPRRLRWVGGPLWARSHEFTSSLIAMVSAQGRLFYILDAGLTGTTGKTTPENWLLVARDAFNGKPLWQRPLEHWGSAAWKNSALRGIPETALRRLVAAGDRVFMTLGYAAPLSALDAATGELVTTFEGTEDTQELRCLDNVLLLRIGKNVVRAIDAKTGAKLWEIEGKIQPLSLAAHGGKFFCQVDQSVLCLDLRKGAELWREPSKTPVSLLLAYDGGLVLLSKQGMQALTADSGKPRWSAKGGTRGQELFVAGGKLWHWQQGGVVGRDLDSGTVTAELDTDDVFTSGHHPRCYQSKATENFMITPHRGAEFISLTGAEHTQNDWLRGACSFGVIPGNGLLYAPPNPCFCYPGVKITGLNALAPEGEIRNLNFEIRNNAERLERGPAYEAIRNPQSAIPNRADWPTYRHDARRSGAAGGKVSAQVSQQWQAQLRGKLTPPVAAAGRVYVAAKDEHTLYALSAKDGKQLWRFTADARIDSPPTIDGERVLFGGADGRVYCLRAADGALAWRWRAAPTSEQILAFGQLESPWRVHGSVLLKNGLAYCTAGRSSYLDGGIWLYALEPASGKVVYEARLDTWARTREDWKDKPFIPGYHMEGAQSDILVSEGDFIFLGQTKFDLKLAQQDVPYVMADPKKPVKQMDLAGQPYILPDREPKQDYETHQRQWLERTQKGLVADLREKHGGINLGDRKIGRHVFATSGFLDDAWYNRTYWMYSETWPGFYLAHRAAKTGQLLVAGPEKTYAVQAFPSRNLQSPLFTPGDKGYLLFADDNDNEPILDDVTRGTTKGWGFTRQAPPAWHQWTPVRIRAMVLAGETLFVAGPPDVIDEQDPMAAFEGRKGGLLWAMSPTDGKKLAEYKLESPPVFDGLIAAGERLYVTTRDGHVTCFAGK